MNKIFPLHDANIDALETDAMQECTHHVELKSGAAVASGLVSGWINDIDTDCNSLAATKLRLKYSAEANSHMNMLARRKQGYTVAPEFLEFRSFLKIVGKIPSPGYTLDRLNSADLEYAPGKVRWASKKEQAVNKQNVILLKGANGVVKPVTEWAEFLKIPATTLKSRRAKGWSDAEVLYGRKSNITYANTPAKYRAAAVFHWPSELAGDWEAGYRQDHLKTDSGYDDDHGNTKWKHETRAAFLVRRLTAILGNLMGEIERTTEPGTNVADDLWDRVQRSKRLRAHALTLTGAAAGPWVELRPRRY